LRSVGYSPQQVEEFIQLGALNAFFVLGRSIGLMGHVMDQKRLQTRLYRQPWDEILFMMPDKPEEVKEA
jgi:ATP-citrate lyase alpha-subunit